MNRCRLVFRVAKKLIDLMCMHMNPRSSAERRHPDVGQALCVRADQHYGVAKRFVGYIAAEQLAEREDGEGPAGIIQHVLVSRSVNGRICAEV